jgi:hypothetical protein
MYKKKLKCFYQKFIRTKLVVFPGRGNHRGTIYIYIYMYMSEGLPVTGYVSGSFGRWVLDARGTS